MGKGKRNYSYATALTTAITASAIALCFLVAFVLAQDERAAAADAEPLDAPAFINMKARDRLTEDEIKDMVMFGYGRGRLGSHAYLQTAVYLQSLDIRVDVAGGIASTRYTMVFKNRTDRALEGELTFPLPDGRTVTHYALDIDSVMRTAVPVVKAKATEVYEDIMEREVDPGIIEKVEGNNFRTRIYPIPPKGTRTVTIGYDEELLFENDMLYYRLPKVSDAPIDYFSFRATVLQSGGKPVVPASSSAIVFEEDGDDYAAWFSRRKYRQPGGLEFALPVVVDTPQVVFENSPLWRGGAERRGGSGYGAEPRTVDGDTDTATTTRQNHPALRAPLQGGESASYYFLATVVPKPDTRKKIWGDELAVIWDVSLSGIMRDRKREFEALDVIFKEKKNVNVHLYFLNNRFRKSINKKLDSGVYRVSGGKWDELKAVLQSAVYDGASDFSQVNISDVTGKEILFFSDGMSSLSDADFIKGAKADRPIHCVVASQRADYDAMKRIAEKSGGKFVNAGAMTHERLKEELLTEAMRYLGAEYGAGVSEVYPSAASFVGGNFSVSGILKDDKAEMTLLFGFGDTVVKRIPVNLDGTRAGASPAPTASGQSVGAPLAGARSSNSISRILAQKKIAELDLDYEKNKDEITKLGLEFGIVTRNTTLIVLESIDDYVQYEIEPPDEGDLRKLYRRKLGEYRATRREKVKNVVEELVKTADSIKAWWDTDFSALPKKSQTDEDEYDDEDGDKNRDKEEKYAPAPRQNRRGTEGIVRGAGYSIVLDIPDNDFRRGLDLDLKKRGDLKVSSPDFLKGGGATNYRRPTIKVKPLKNDDEFYKRLTGDIEKDYPIYLKLRDEYAESPAFYFGISDWFYSRGDKETALRVLTNIAELDIENSSLYRLLGFRFKEYGEYALQKFVRKKVVEWRPMDPQSFRDYALALADAGEEQTALDSLYALLLKREGLDKTRGWRFKELDETVLVEMNRLIAKNPKLSVSNIDERLIMDIPVDIRVVMNWNLRNVDIDLKVIDPNWEGSRHNGNTEIGGRMSVIHNGPEQFMLKKAIAGKYKILVKYSGKREFAQDGPATVMVEIFSNHAGINEQRKVVTLQLNRAKKTRRGMVEVAELEF